MKYALLLVLTLHCSSLSAQWRNLHGIYGGNVTSAVQSTQSPGKPVLIGTENGVWRSTDHFKTWSASGLQGMGVQRLYIVKDDSTDVVFAAVQSYKDMAFDQLQLTLFGDVPQSLWLSTDAGATWDSLATYSGPIVGLFRLANTLYAVVRRQGNPSEIYLTNDVRAAPLHFHGALPPKVSDAEGIGDYIVAINDWSPLVQWTISQETYRRFQDTVFGTSLVRWDSVLIVCGSSGPLYSIDSGRTWQQRGGQAVSIPTVLINGDTLLGQGYRSTDRGYTWQAVAGPPAAGSLIAAVDGAWLASTVTDLYCSDNAVDWRPAQHGIEAPAILDVALRKDSIYVAASQGILLSADHGSTWTNTSAPVYRSNEVYRFQDVEDTLFLLAHAMYKWTGSWRKVVDSTVYSIARKDNALFIAGSSRDKSDGFILRSTNNGASWTDVSAPRVVEMIGYSDLAVNGSLLFVTVNGWSGANALYVSSDDGDHWEEVPHDPWGNQGSFVSFGPDLYVATQLGLLRSTNAGVSWSQVPGVAALSGLRTTQHELLVLSIDTVTSLMRISTDGSIHVEVSGDSLSELRSMAANDSMMLVGTASRGVWMAPIAPSAVRPTLRASDALEIYPNPATASVTIDLAERSGRPVLHVFDVTGRAIDAQYTFAGHRIMIDTRGLPSGVYSVVISNMGRSLAGSFVVDR